MTGHCDLPHTSAYREAQHEASEQRIRERSIALAFYACMSVVSLQIISAVAEITWDDAHVGQLPDQIIAFSILASIPWLLNGLAIASGASGQFLSWVRTETVFAMSFIATFIGTYNLGFNVQIGAFGIYCGVIGTLRAGALNGNIRVASLLAAALAALILRPGGLSDAGLTSATALKESLSWNLFAPFLQPYSLGIVLNVSIDYLMKSYQRSRVALTQAYDDLNDRWERDALTGLFSRTVMDTKFQSACHNADRDDARIAVALIDLDNFKNINSFCGHSAGDKALTAFAERLQKLLPNALLFRLGGDEFLAVQPIQDDEADFTMQLERCCAPLELVYERDELRLSASVGVTIAEIPCSYQQAASEADIALRQAKRDGKGGLITFQAGASVPDASTSTRPSMVISAADVSASKSEVPAREVGAAILNNQIGYAIQPIYDAKKNRMTGAECLLRWRLDDGSIVPIDHYLNTFVSLEWQTPYMQHLFEKRDQLFTAIRALGDIDVHFNYAANALTGASFDQHVISALTSTPLNMSGWVIEISEQSAREDKPVMTDRQMAVLKNAGMKIAIDDFGVGQSNLERLANVDADIVKLDKQFVAEGTRTKRGMEILRHAKNLTDALNIQLIAEGIETAEQQSLLLDAGITCHQGFFKGRPMWPNQFLRTLRQHSMSEQLAI